MDVLALIMALAGLYLMVAAFKNDVHPVKHAKALLGRNVNAAGQ